MGKHFAGKSKTIREYLKPKLGLTKDQKKFLLNGEYGYILSQSFEEGNRNVDEMIKKYSHYNYLVLAGRPKNENGSLVERMENKLISENYTVEIFEVIKSDDENYYNEKANEIHEWLRQ